MFIFILSRSFFFQAASTPLNPLSFQCEFVKLRIDLLQAFSQLICTCNSLKTSPPPAIATTIAMTLGNDLQRCGRISNQACLNFIFSAVLIDTLEVFEVICDVKDPEIYKSLVWLIVIKPQMLISPSTLPKIGWCLIRTTEIDDVSLNAPYLYKEKGHTF